MGFIQQKQADEQKQKNFVRRLMASASVRVSDDAAQVAELEQAIAQMQINLQAAKRRAAASQASLDELQAMWKDLDA